MGGSRGGFTSKILVTAADALPEGGKFQGCDAVGFDFKGGFAVGETLGIDDALVHPCWQHQAERIECHRRAFIVFLSTFGPGNMPECPTCGTPETIRDKMPEIHYCLGEIDAELGPLQTVWQKSEEYRRQMTLWHQQERNWIREHR